MNIILANLFSKFSFSAFGFCGQKATVGNGNKLENQNPTCWPATKRFPALVIYF